MEAEIGVQVLQRKLLRACTVKAVDIAVGKDKTQILERKWYVVD